MLMTFCPKKDHYSSITGAGKSLLPPLPEETEKARTWPLFLLSTTLLFYRRITAFVRSLRVKLFRQFVLWLSSLYRRRTPHSVTPIHFLPSLFLLLLRGRSRARLKTAAENGGGGDGGGGGERRGPPRRRGERIPRRRRRQRRRRREAKSFPPPSPTEGGGAAAASAAVGGGS